MGYLSKTKYAFILDERVTVFNDKLKKCTHIEQDKNKYFLSNNFRWGIRIMLIIYNSSPLAKRSIISLCAFCARLTENLSIRNGPWSVFFFEVKPNSFLFISS